MGVESDDSVGVPSEGTCVVDDACQLFSVSEPHRDVRVVRLVNFARAVSSTRS